MEKKDVKKQPDKCTKFSSIILCVERIASIVLVLVTIILAILAYKQWDEMSASVKIMNKSIELTQTSERPFVGLENIILSKPLSIGHVIEIDAEHKNYGKSPAMSTKIWCKIDIIPAQNTVDFDNYRKILPNNRSSSILWPNQSSGIHTPIKTKEVLTEDIYRKIMNEGMIVFVSGFIDYESVYGKKYRTVFCWIYNLEYKQFQTYKLYNFVIETE